MSAERTSAPKRWDGLAQRARCSRNLRKRNWEPPWLPVSFGTYPASRAGSQGPRVVDYAPENPKGAGRPSASHRPIYRDTVCFGTPNPFTSAAWLGTVSPASKTLRHVGEYGGL